MTSFPPHNHAEFDVESYVNAFREHIWRCGLSQDQFRRVPEDIISPYVGTPTAYNIEAKLREASRRNITLVVFLMQNYDVAIYRDFKNLTDRFFGMQTICMVHNETWNTMTQKQYSDLMTNIMMKLNLKLGGVNHVVPAVRPFLEDTMILGGDIIKPGTGSFPGTPSIASIVGSVDLHGGKCLGSMRLQSVDKTDTEVSQLRMCFDCN